MTHGMSLKHVEREAFASQFEDGLWDVLIGTFLLMFVFALYLSESMGDFWSSFVQVLFCGLALGAVKLVKSRVVKPRSGMVTYGADRRAKLIKYNILLVVLLTVSLGLGILSAVVMSAPWVHGVRFGVVLLACFSVAGYFLDFPRLYLWGVMIGAGTFLSELLWQRYRLPHHGYQLVLGAISGVITVTGFALFAKFLRTHQPPPEGHLSETNTKQAENEN